MAGDRTLNGGYRETPVGLEMESGAERQVMRRERDGECGHVIEGETEVAAILQTDMAHLKEGSHQKQMVRMEAAHPQLRAEGMV